MFLSNAGEFIQPGNGICEPAGRNASAHDTVEADGLFSAMHVLPQLAAAALLGTTVGKPGWQDARSWRGARMRPSQPARHFTMMRSLLRECLSKTVRMSSAC